MPILDPPGSAPHAIRAAAALISFFAQRVGPWLRGACSDLASDWADGIWPERCWLCGVAVPGVDRDTGLACSEHTLGATLVGSRCDRCASTLAPGLAHGTRCRTCRIRPPGFRAVHAASDYGDDAVRSWLLAFKHGGRADLAAPLAAHLARSLTRASGGTCWGGAWGRRPREPVARRLLVPVPLHPVRLLERGYDQASLLAAHLAEYGIGPSVPLLRRVRPTPPQGSEMAESRRGNVRGAFRCRVRIPPGTSIALVDDVLASGATADACAAALRQAGAVDVRVLVVARA